MFFWKKKVVPKTPDEKKEQALQPTDKGSEEICRDVATSASVENALQNAGKTQTCASDSVVTRDVALDGGQKNSDSPFAFGRREDWTSDGDSAGFGSGCRSPFGAAEGHNDDFDDPSLKREFELYKVQKTLKKLGVFACMPARSTEDVKAEVVKARAYGFRKVAVYPAAVQQAIRAADEDGDPDVIAAISFPHGEDALSVKKFAAKQAFAAGADGILVCLSLSPVKRGDYRAVKKEADAILSAFSHRGEVGFFVDLTLSDMAETEKLFRQFQKAENLFVLRISGDVSPKSVLSTLKTFAPDAKWAVLSERSDDAFLTEAIDAGAERVYTPFSEEVATRLLSRYRFTVNDLKLAREKDD